MSRKTLSKGNELHKLGRLLARGQDKERGGISIVASRGAGGEGWAPQSWSRTDSSSWPEKHSQFEAAVIGTGVRLACSRDRCRGRDPPNLSSSVAAITRAELEQGRWQTRENRSPSTRSLDYSRLRWKSLQIFLWQIVYPRDTMENARWISK